MKAFVIVGLTILATTVVFIWYVRITKQPKKTKPPEETLFV